MNRAQMFDHFSQRNNWDLVVIGGGATGAGCAVDAASRGFSVLLLEQSDFGKGTSSRSTKLIHGGVRYLAQGNLRLVREALRERGILKRNAPHLVKESAFVIPNYEWQKMALYGAGLKIYNFLSGKYGFQKSSILSRSETLEKLPTVQSKGLRGGVIYYDGQFDDARLLINLMTTAAEQGAVVLNYARVFELKKNSQGFVSSVNFVDEISGQQFLARAKTVVNGTGAFCDQMRQMADADAERIIQPSQGVHIVLDDSFLPGDNALMIPETSDGRVMFAIPWHGATLIGTTDTPIESISLEPQAFDEEIEFLLATAGKYLTRQPTRTDIRSVFTGIRPLVKTASAKNTAALARDHTIEIDRARMLTVTGGKWTTYRLMAEDAVTRAAELADLPAKSCATKNLKIHGFDKNAERFGKLAVYGADAANILDLIEENPSLKERIHPRLSYSKAEIVWAARQEMAQTVEDVLARRTRALFLDARAAIEAAPIVAEILSKELGRDEKWQQEQIKIFEKVAAVYQIN